MADAVPTVPPPAARSDGTPAAPTVAAGSVAAVVVNYNAAPHLVACVQSLVDEGAGPIVVVDNASVDASREVLAGSGLPARFLPAGRNLGYGAGANLGTGVTESELVLVCNADVVLMPGVVTALSQALEEDPRRAIAGPRIEDMEGRLYPSARTFPALGDAVGHAFLGMIAPGNRWSTRYKMLGWDHATRTEVDWVSGACFLARRDALGQLGGFDESYFMYSEDVDLCWRAWKAGWKVVYEPAGTIRHIQGASTDHHPYRMIAEHHRALLRFAYRSNPGWRRLLLPVVAAGLGVRTLMAWAQRLGEQYRTRH